jgi:hypothetical protein
MQAAFAISATKGSLSPRLDIELHTGESVEESALENRRERAQFSGRNRSPHPAVTARSKNFFKKAKRGSG